MKSKSIYKAFYLVTAVLLLAWIFVTVKELHSWGGRLLMLLFLSLAVAFRGNRFLKGFSYTVMIFASVSLSMYYPHYGV